VRRVRLAVIALLAVGLVSCSQPGYDGGKLQSELRRAGLTEQQAKCVTDGMKNSFDTNQLASLSDPTQKQVDKTRLILKGCGVTQLRT
jgi:hypothetical protein